MCKNIINTHIFTSVRTYTYIDKVWIREINKVQGTHFLTAKILGFDSIRIAYCRITDVPQNYSHPFTHYGGTQIHLDYNYWLQSCLLTAELIELLTYCWATCLLTAELITYTLIAEPLWSKESPPPRGGFLIYCVPWSRTGKKRTPLEEFVPGASRWVLFLWVLDQGT